MAYEVFESNSAFVTVSFFDKDGVAAAPASAQYRILRADDGAVILNWTSLSPASVITITVKSTENVRQAATGGLERHRLDIQATYGTGDVLEDRIFFYVKALPT